jgi:hypothetical protein
MKLKRIPDRDPKRRISVSLRSSVLIRLHQYREYYQEVYGTELDMATALEEILNEFIGSDKEFAKSSFSRKTINLDATDAEGGATGSMD